MDTFQCQLNGDVWQCSTDALADYFTKAQEMHTYYITDLLLLSFAVAFAAMFVVGYLVSGAGR